MGKIWAKRIVLIILIILLLALISSISILIILYYGRSPGPCTSLPCIKAAAQILDSIDSSIDPCDHFYEFVCGNFLKRSMETQEITPFSKLQTITNNRINSLISDGTSGIALKPLELQRKFYQTCINVSFFENNGMAILDLVEKLVSWPVLHGRFWNGSNFDWITLMVKARQLGLSYEFFMKLRVEEMGNIVVLSISPPIAKFWTSQLRQEYISLMTNIAIELGAPKDNARIDFLRVLDFEEQIALLNEDERKHGQEVDIALSKLALDFSTIPWLEFLSNLTGTTFTPKTLIRFKAKRYLTNLLNILENTPARVQANYIIWKNLELHHQYLSKNIRHWYNSFLHLIKPDRNVFCLNQAKFYFPSVAEVAYVRKYLSKDARNHVQKLIEIIRKFLLKQIGKTPWLDETSKEVSEKILGTLESQVGASNAIFEHNFDQVVDLEGLSFPSDNIISMVATLNARRVQNYFKVLHRNFTEIAKIALELTPMLDVNAFYIENVHTLVLPASFLQGVIYDFHQPLYINFGALGSVIGHELAHIVFSASTEWSSESQQQLENKTQCLVESYNKYTNNSESFTNGRRMDFKEIAATLIGTSLSYEIYQNLIIEIGEEQTLPGINFNHNQLFWIASGTYQCYQSKLLNVSSTDQNHGVPSFTVAATVQNSPEFSKDFNCKIGAMMNPVKKCKYF